jgi:hypothetical protein
MRNQFLTRGTREPQSHLVACEQHTLILGATHSTHIVNVPNLMRSISKVGNVPIMNCGLEQEIPVFTRRSSVCSNVPVYLGGTLG